MQMEARRVVQREINRTGNKAKSIRGAPRSVSANHRKLPLRFDITFPNSPKKRNSLDIGPVDPPPSKNSSVSPGRRKSDPRRTRHSLRRSSVLFWTKASLALDTAAESTADLVRDVGTIHAEAVLTDALMGRQSGHPRESADISAKTANRIEPTPASSNHTKNAIEGLRIDDSGAGST